MLFLSIILLISSAPLSLVTGDAPTLDVPIFKLLNKEISQVGEGVVVEFTFKNIGSPATTGAVWLPWEKIYFIPSLSGSPPGGSINETILSFDVNGDFDKSDVFRVSYIDDSRAEVNGTIARAMHTPEQTFNYADYWLSVGEKTDFTLGSKRHALYFIEESYAVFAIDSFFRDHSSPNIEILLFDEAVSLSDTMKAEVTSFKLNGASLPFEFNWVMHEFGEQWGIYNIYVYPLNFIDTNEVFTISLSVKGESGNYTLYTLFNWSPDGLHRYRYVVYDATEISLVIPETSAPKPPSGFPFGSIFMFIFLFVVIVAFVWWMGRRAKKVKEMEGEPVILVSFVSHGAWGGYLYLTNSRLIYRKVLSKKHLIIPLNDIVNYEAKHDSLYITTKTRQYRFYRIWNINQWMSKLHELIHR